MTTTIYNKEIANLYRDYVEENDQAKSDIECNKLQLIYY